MQEYPLHLLINQALLWVVNSRPTIIGTNFEQVKYIHKKSIIIFKQGFFWGGKDENDRGKYIFIFTRKNRSFTFPSLKGDGGGGGEVS
jgi:hypothetical protein